MLTFVFRQLLGVAVVSSPIWGAAILCTLLRRDRKNSHGMKTVGTATALYVSTRGH